MTLTNSSTRAAIEKLVSQNVEKILVWKKCRIMHCLRVTDLQNVMYTKFYVIEAHQKWRAHRVFRGCCDWRTSMFCQNFLRLLHFTRSQIYYSMFTPSLIIQYSGLHVSSSMPLISLNKLLQESQCLVESYYILRLRKKQNEKNKWK